ncbi:hypothetical protein PS928_00501 [Pseudomonas fluorescens]|uniref:Uncharacterized protein n=1 Tax=Pseudomonas fluorescens TaxID=294 RepID=A0A5E7RXR5_PSEFL|nr:hypothetical protein PS928_00501 [Pseudomonas fluorescens]
MPEKQVRPLYLIPRSAFQQNQDQTPRAGLLVPVPFGTEFPNTLTPSKQ